MVAADEECNIDGVELLLPALIDVADDIVDDDDDDDNDWAPGADNDDDELLARLLASLFWRA